MASGSGRLRGHGFPSTPRGTPSESRKEKHHPRRGRARPDVKRAVGSNPHARGSPFGYLPELLAVLHRNALELQPTGRGINPARERHLGDDRTGASSPSSEVAVGRPGQLDALGTFGTTEDAREKHVLQTPFNRFGCAADQAARGLETPLWWPDGSARDLLLPSGGQFLLIDRADADAARDGRGQNCGTQQKGGKLRGHREKGIALQTGETKPREKLRANSAGL